MARLAGKIALVTGATRGIGRAVARRFALEGAHVIAVGRTQGALEELDDEIRGLGGEATLLVLDLAKPAQIDGLAQPLYERWGRLDVFVGNAGLLGRLTPTAQTPPDVWQQVFDVNVHANFRFIRALDPLLRAAPAGRAIFVTSSAAQKTKAYHAAYSASKAALERLALVWAAEVELTPLRVNILDPGATRTAMRALAFPGEDPEAVKPPESLADLFVRMAADDCPWRGEVVRASEVLSGAAQSSVLST